MAVSPCWAGKMGLSQIFDVDGSSGMTVNFALRFGGTHDPECDCREAEAPLQGRLQGPPLRGVADPAGGLVVSALSAQLPRHRGAVSGARLGGRPLHPEPLGPGLRAAARAPVARLSQAALWLD